MIYGIQATVRWEDAKGRTLTKELPMFYFDSEVPIQTNPDVFEEIHSAKDAARIAKHMLEYHEGITAEVLVYPRLPHSVHKAAISVVPTTFTIDNSGRISKKNKK